MSQRAAKHLCSVLWLQLINGPRLLAGVDSTEAAAASARVPKKHHCCRAGGPVPALANVWALRFLTDGRQFEAGQICLHLLVFFPLWRSLPAHGRGGLAYQMRVHA